MTTRLERARTNDDGPAPSLRGTSHAFAVVFAILGTAFLLSRTRTTGQVAAIVVFGAAQTSNFLASAMFHRVKWRTPRAKLIAKRIDHGMIFVTIAGGFTPLLALVPASSGGHLALVFMWVVALVGIGKSVFWPNPPMWLNALFYIAYGWMGAAPSFDRAAQIGLTAPLLVAASGAIYTVGGVVYALKWPDPVPAVFGYHEVFHLFVILGAATLFLHAAAVLSAVQ